uniref:ABC transporter n=1 Tax=Bionectria ochroleuca TaxID=29856 RepID=A0A8H7TLM0_BIOOC
MAEDSKLAPELTPETKSRPSERKPAFSDYLRVFTYATKPDYFFYTVASLASIGAGITMPLMNIIFGQLVGQFTDFFRDTSSISQNDFKQILNKQALYIMALFFVRWALSAINKFCFRMIGIRLSSAIRLHYLESLFAQPIHVIDSLPAGAPATAITGTSNTLQIGVSDRLGVFLQYMSTIISALVISFTWSWDLTLVTSSLLIYLIVLLCIFMPILIKGQAATLKSDAQGNSVASEALGVMRLVMSCGAQSRIFSRYQGWVIKAKKEGQKTAPIVGMQVGGMFFGVFGAFGLAFWYGTQRYASGHISNAGVVVVVLMSVMLIFNSVERISTPLIAVSKAMVAACELTSEDLIFDNVVFEYPSRPGVKALDGLNLRIRSGKNTALVGPSGSGKSTIVALLERWYSLQSHYALPKVALAQGQTESSEDEKGGRVTSDSETPSGPALSGSVSFGTINLEDIDLKWWRSQIGLVQQEPFLFNETIFKNVANGLIGTEYEDEPESRKRELVRDACNEACAHEFIDRLPEGYDTRVGDGGAKLSGGQKQRIAIARSIIKKPKIIILDEATSAIDVQSEKHVQEALERLVKNHTTITIAHRLSTIKKADHIVVLKRGQAVEEGTHQELLSNEGGVYSALVRAQALLGSGEGEDESLLTEPKIAPGEKTDNLPRKALHTVQVKTSQRSNPIQRNRGFVYSLALMLSEQRAQWLNMTNLVISAMAVAAGTPLQAWLFAKAIAVFILEGDELRTKSNFWGLMWLALAGGFGIAWFSQTWNSVHLQYGISAAYKQQYFRDMLQQRLSFHDEEDNAHGTLSYRISSDAKQLEELFGLNLAAALTGIFTFTGCIIIALIFSWRLGLVAAFATMPVMVGAGLWRYRHEVQFDEMNSSVFKESSLFATEAIGSIRTVSSLGMERVINARYAKLLSEHVQTALRKAQWTAPVYGFADSVSLGCQALVFWYGGSLLSKGELSMDAFFVCFMAIMQGSESSSQILSVSPDFAQAIAAANRIRSVHESAVLNEKMFESGSGRSEDLGGNVRLELKDVSFKYPTRNIPVFDHLNLCIEKEQYVAFVGPSGSGKTSIISLLERFYEPNQGGGQILCNGVDIKDLSLSKYRNMLSLVPQEPTMLQGSIRDNILFGIANPESISNEMIHDVCRDAFIHDFIVSLPEGYDTDVGQKGVSMSGGQKQRIAIARALIRNPKVLLLDEATSALDSESEKIVQAAFEKARKGRSMIAIAHRLSTIQDADVIFVLDQGQIVEKGTHFELMKKRGIYFTMCESQALDR